MMKTNPKQSICNEVERLWETWMKTKESVDHATYVNYIEKCPEDFVEHKKMRGA